MSHSFSYSRQLLLSMSALSCCVGNLNSFPRLVQLAPRTRRLFSKAHDAGTFGIKVPISIFSSLHTCDSYNNNSRSVIISSRPNVISNHSFCNRCWSTSCIHSPGTTENGKLTYSFKSLIPDIDAGVRYSNKIIKLSVFSYNCMSLKENTGDVSDAVKLDFQSRALLVHNITHKHFHVIGLQEARTNDRSFAVPGFQCVASGHDRRNFGVELWFSSLENIQCVDPVSGSETLIGFDLDQLVTVHKEPRLLIVSVGIQHEAVVFVVLHAPDQTHGIIKVTAWWNNFFSLIAKYSIDLASTVIIGDFNLKFGSRLSNAVGGHYRQKQHSGARPLHKWMLDHNFSPIHIPRTPGLFPSPHIHTF